MNTREWVTGTGAAVLAGLVGNTLAQDASHAHHHGAGGPNAALLAATADGLV